MSDNSDKEEGTLEAFKTLPDIPMLTITDIKQSPMTGFEAAATHGTGVYITRRGETVGVILTPEKYETLVKRAKSVQPDDD